MDPSSMKPLTIAAGTVLRPWVESDAAELASLVACNRDRLAPWLGWATPY